MQTSRKRRHKGKFITKAHQQELQQEFQHKKLMFLCIGLLFIFAVLSIWIMQNSVNAYYFQTYHKPSPLTSLNESSLWAFGGEIGTMLYTTRDNINDFFVQENSTSVEQFNHALTLKKQMEEAQQPAVEVATQPVLTDSTTSSPQENVNTQAVNTSSFTLSSTDEIFFAGDSMMQGVAPHVQKYLQQNYNIKSVNLSKQSTGLSYPKFFNWPKTIETTLEKNDKIKILVIFLGPNDPWDMPNDKGVYLRFKSAEWETLYRSRIAEILQTAQKHNVAVMWISPPNMRKKSLNEQMIYLNQVLANEVALHPALFIDSRPLVGGKDDIYNEYLEKDGKMIKMRSSDGIHFSPEGQKRIATVIQDHLTIIPAVQTTPH